MDQNPKRFPDRTLVSPSACPCTTTNCNPTTNTKDWFESFFSNCTQLGGCRVDFLATNIYNCSADYTMAFLKDLYETYRVSTITLDTLFFAISRLPKHLGWKCWSFSRSPQNSDFKNVLNFENWPIFDRDMASSMLGTWFQNQHFKTRICYSYFRFY